MAGGWRLVACAVLAAMGVMDCATGASGQLAPPTRLSVEYLLCGGPMPGHVDLRPIGIDKPYPRLQWLVAIANSSMRGIRQTAYQVLVFQVNRVTKQATQYWDSGKMVSNRNVYVSSDYANALKPLQSDSDYKFQVKWFSNTGLTSEWSETADFSTALLSQSDWSAEWITSPTPTKSRREHSRPTQREVSGVKPNAEPPRSQMIRGDFTFPIVSRLGIVRSRLYVSGLGYYELWQNGAKVNSQRRLGPQTYHEKRVLYDTYDYDVALGKNTIALRLGPGFWAHNGNPSLWAIAQLHITASDGTEYIVKSHGKTSCNATKHSHGTAAATMTELHSTWLVHDDPCTFSDMYRGEHYDARLEVAEWDSPSFNDQSWNMAYSPVGAQCTVAPENKPAVLGCPASSGSVISAIKFASFGMPSGTCETGCMAANTFTMSACDAKNTTAIVEKLCLGKKTCRVPASRKLFGDECGLAVQHLSVSVECGPAKSRHMEEDRYSGSVIMDLPREADLVQLADVASPEPPHIGELSSQPMTHITSPLEPVEPVSVKQISSNVHVYDFGINAAAVCLLEIDNVPSGTVVTVMKGEELNENGTVHNQLSVNMTSVYICRGGKLHEAWQPSWVYYGFQYAQVTVSGPPLENADEQIKVLMIPMTSAPTSHGYVEFKEPETGLLNKIQAAIRRTQASNLMSVPTDCPNREKRGWMGDAQVTAMVAMWNYDMPAFYTNWIRSMNDVQLAGTKGMVPDIVPGGKASIEGTTDATWSSAYPLISFYMYQQYGDRELVREHYTGLKAYVDYLTTTTDHDTGLLLYHKYGDWCNMYPRPQEITTTGPISACFHYLIDLQLVSGFAGILGLEEDAVKYMQMHNNLLDPFHSHFYNASVGGYVDGTQTVNLLPLFGRYIPDAVHDTVADNLLHDITVTQNMHLSTGAVGTRYLMPVLTQLGRPDIAFALARKKTFPSWGYWMTQGATSLWENWSGKADLTHPPAPTHDHIFLGSHGSWLYEVGLGIKPMLPGFERISIRPPLTYFNNNTITEVCRQTEGRMVLDLEGAEGSYDSVRGPISVTWLQQAPDANNTVFIMDVNIPPNTNASVYLPQRVLCTMTDGQSVFPPSENVTVTEGGKLIWFDNYAHWPMVPGITSGGLLGLENAIVFEVGSGTYHFEVQEVN